MFFGTREVGRLTCDPLTFVYEQAWLETEDRFPISVALPLSTEIFGDAPVRAFFFNLLPEGNVRRRLCARLGISEGNDYRLLTEIGGECAGALSVAKSAKPEEASEYLPLSDEELTKRIARGGALVSAAGEEGVRLSLAGAQDKLPVYLQGEEMYLPKGAGPSNHILKLDSRDFKQLPVNEVMILRLAEASGLPTVRARLRRLGRSMAALIERFDRKRNGVIARLHQEDFCQALGVPAERKYEAEGGPRFAECVELLRAHSISPLEDVHSLTRWQLFNVAVGNAAGHAKNLALLHGPGGTRLAPFYDLVSTRAYPRVEGRLAMSVGGNFNPDTLQRKNWARFAADLGVGDRYVRALGCELADSLQAAIDPTLRSLEAEYGRKDFLRSAVVPIVRRSTKRLLASLER